ncbi:hypothetical protein [Streptomyces sp. NPDC046985]|uniref:hypothetical protein n=1 Tax=Streptomyces sp. NPDC046985 TaxID=3155377 RepID=UPI00340B3704
MTWTTPEFGPSHAGYVGAVLADGSEPETACIDLGSGSNFQTTNEWWAYTGRLNRPKAAAVRAACACGWRGAAVPLDWDRLEGGYLDDDPFHDEWSLHIEAVAGQTVPLPRDLDELLILLEEQLDRLALDAPPAAIKAADVLDRLGRRIGQRAARTLDDDLVQREALGTALGISPEAARSRIAHYRLSPYARDADQLDW